jgi:tyrosine-protein phosphatase SIW14
MNQDRVQLRRSQALRVGFVLLLFAGAAVWIFAYLHIRRPARFAVVEQGRLYRSSQPSTRQIENLIDQFGIKTIVIARSDISSRVPDEIDFAKSHGIRVIHLPIESRSQIPEHLVQEFLKCVDDPASGPILVHCAAGRHRTGYLCARYRVDRQGWTLDKAIAELLSFGFDTNHEGVVLEQLKNYQRN